MSELRLEYQPSPPFPLAGSVLFALAVGMLMLTGAYYLKLSDQTISWETKLERMKSKGTAPVSAGRIEDAASQADLALEVNAANAVLRQLTVPWDDFFGALESSGRGKVTLLALEPDVEKLQVKVVGETKNYEGVMSYITQLEGKPIFSSVYLLNHHVEQQDPDKPVRFSLVAAWRENLQ